MIASSNPVEIPCDSGMQYVENIISINSLCLDIFPSDHEVVPDDVMRSCAAVKGSKWEEIGVLLGISLDNLKEIGDSTSSVVIRMFKVLKSWTERAKSPTVGKLLKLFEEVGVNRRLIKMKFDELYG